MSDQFFYIEKENFTVIVGNLIYEIRTNSNLSQEKLGELTGFDRTYIGAIERGEKNVSFYAMYKIFKALKIDATDFINKI